MAERTRNLYYNARLASIAAHVLALVLVLCLSLMLVTFGEWLTYGWKAQGLVLTCFLVSLEALLSYRLVTHWDATLSQKVIYRSAEGVLLLVFLKVFTELRYGIDYFLGNLLNWPIGFGRYFFTSDFVFNIVIFFLVWLSTTLFGVYLHEMEHTDDLFRWHDPQRSYQPLYRRVLNLYLMVGLLMVLLAGTMRQDFFILPIPPPRLQPDLLILVTYFVAGMVLLSLTYFAHLWGKWGYEGAHVARNLASRWISYVAGFLVLLAGGALALPTNYSLALLDALRFVLGWISAIVQFVLAIVSLFFLYLVSLISRLWSDAPEMPVTPVPTRPRLEDYAPPPQAEIPWWETLKGVLFWGVLLAVLIFALRQYLQANQELLQSFQRFAFWRWLKALWQWLRGSSRNVGKGVMRLIRGAAQRLRTLTTPRQPRLGWQYLSLGRLTPRQRVLFYYLALLRRADEAGFPRPGWQTPLEFAQKLQNEMAEDKENIATLTEAFDEARYSAHEVGEGEVGKARLAWEQVRLSLRHHKRFRDSS